MSEREFTSPTLSDRFVHILSAADTIDEWLQGLSPRQLADDRILSLALERLLEIISVATDHIPTNLKETEVDVDWQNLAYVGRRLENASDRIEPEVLWDIARHKLAPLKSFAQRYVEA